MSCQKPTPSELVSKPHEVPKSMTPRLGSRDHPEDFCWFSWWFVTFYWSFTILHHHLGEDFLIFPTTLSKAKKKKISLFRSLAPPKSHLLFLVGFCLTKSQGFFGICRIVFFHNAPKINVYSSITKTKQLNWDSFWCEPIQEISNRTHWTDT